MSTPDTNLVIKSKINYTELKGLCPHSLDRLVKRVPIISSYVQVRSAEWLIQKKIKTVVSLKKKKKGSPQISFSPVIFSPVFLLLSEQTYAMTYRKHFEELQPVSCPSFFGFVNR